RRSCRRLDAAGDPADRPRARRLLHGRRPPGLRRRDGCPLGPHRAGRCGPPRAPRRRPPPGRSRRPPRPPRARDLARGDPPIPRRTPPHPLKGPPPMSQAAIPATEVGSESAPTLKRVLGVPSLVLFGLVYMVPLTVFPTYGIVTQLTGGRVAVSYVITLVAMLFTARSYARMSVAYPYAGSAYVYTQRSFGGAGGFLPGWSLMLDYLFLPMINYLVIGIYLEAAFPAVPAWVFILASIAIVTVLNVVGIVSVAR